LEQPPRFQRQARTTKRDHAGVPINQHSQERVLCSGSVSERDGLSNTQEDVEMTEEARNEMVWTKSLVLARFPAVTSLHLRVLVDDAKD
jgi:hypothetical protein